MNRMFYLVCNTVIPLQYNKVTTRGQYNVIIISLLKSQIFFVGIQHSSPKKKKFSHRWFLPFMLAQNQPLTSIVATDNTIAIKGLPVYPYVQQKKLKLVWNKERISTF